MSLNMNGRSNTSVLLGELAELGQRGGDELHVAEGERFHFLGVAEQLRVRIDLDLHLAGQQPLGRFLELERRLPFRGFLGDDVTEL